MYCSKAYVTPDPMEVGTGKVNQILGISRRMNRQEVLSTKTRVKHYKGDR